MTARDPQVRRITLQEIKRLRSRYPNAPWDSVSVDWLVTEVERLRETLAGVDHSAFRYTIDRLPFWGIEDDVMENVRAALAAKEDRP